MHLRAHPLQVLRAHSPQVLRAHPFQTIQLATSTAPYVPVLSSDVDTSNFETVDPSSGLVSKAPVNPAYVGLHLPFLGFTFTGVGTETQRQDAAVLNETPSNPTQQTVAHDQSSMESPTTHSAGISAARDTTAGVRSQELQAELAALQDAFAALKRDKHDADRRITDLRHVADQHKMDVDKHERLRCDHASAVRGHAAVVRQMADHEATITQLKAAIAVQTRESLRTQEALQVLL